jgi:CheY-like chemotaxis protein
MIVDFLKAKILIVDDEQANVSLLEDILENEGYSNFESTQDSRKALDMYKKSRPDLVLLDLTCHTWMVFRSWNNSGKLKKVPTLRYWF